jgi:hypothetical protein
LAKLTIQCILNLNDAITSVIPGLSTVYEVDNAACADYTRPLGQTAEDKEWLERITDEQWSALPLQ